MLFGSQGKRIHVDALIGAASVSLVRLNPREVRSFTLREAILAVELELSNNDGVLAPTVHVERGLGQNKGSGVRNSRAAVEVGGANEILEGDTRGLRLLLKLHVVGVVGISGFVDIGAIKRVQATKLRARVGVIGSIPIIVCVHLIRHGIKSASVIEGALTVDISVLTGKLLGSSESVDSIGKSVNRVSVVEGLSAKNLEENRVAKKGRAIIHILIGLNNPDKLLYGVIEVELDLIRRRTNRLVTSELELGDQILVRVLGKTTTLVSIQKHVIDIQGGGDKRLVIRDNRSHGGAGAGRIGLVGRNRGVVIAVQAGNRPQALINRANIKVDLDLVVLESNQRESKTGVGAKPELERHV